MSDARSVTLNYTGGSLTTTIGVAKSIFGDDYSLLSSTAVPVTSEVSEHPRVRVIGGSSTTVKKHNRNYQQWPTSQATNAAAGTAVLMTWQDSNGSWTGRVTGTMAAFGTFLSEVSPKPIVFRTSRGTKYGPFNGAIDDGN